jgi:hypothetical protein
MWMDGRATRSDFGASSVQRSPYKAIPRDGSTYLSDLDNSPDVLQNWV